MSPKISWWIAVSIRDGVSYVNNEFRQWWKHCKNGKRERKPCMPSVVSFMISWGFNQFVCIIYITVASAIEHILQYIEWILKGKMYTFFSLIGNPIFIKFWIHWILNEKLTQIQYLSHLSLLHKTLLVKVFWTISKPCPNFPKRKKWFY